MSAMLLRGVSYPVLGEQRISGIITPSYQPEKIHRTYGKFFHKCGSVCIPGKDIGCSVCQSQTSGTTFPRRILGNALFSRFRVFCCALGARLLRGFRGGYRFYSHLCDGQSRIFQVFCQAHFPLQPYAHNAPRFLRIFWTGVKRTHYESSFHFGKADYQYQPAAFCSLLRSPNRYYNTLMKGNN